VLADAQALLARIRDERLLTLQGVAGIFAARSEGDDLVVTDPKGREKRLAMLRNQNPAEGCRSLADYLAPDGDWLGCFAVTAGIGLKGLCEKFRSDNDEYSALLIKLLADRLTEAFAEAVHSFVRRQMWGYETGPQLTPAAILKGDYRGRRMAFGYPASPDHTLKREVFDLLAVGQTTGMRLTENCMIDPGESLCGLLFADADYFAIGPIDREQAEDYARRRGCTLDELEKLLPNNYRP
ncbi:MAG: methionine synthase, partial [Alistipes sp.]|nr:methionine synthase [Alistipes sp.]